jgi:hypothetical protein
LKEVATRGVADGAAGKRHKEVQGSESEAGVAAEKTFESDEVVKGSRTEVERIVALECWSNCGPSRSGWDPDTFTDLQGRGGEQLVKREGGGEE